MADDYANVTLAHKIHSDRRFDLMAEIAGWSRWEVIGRMGALWARCTALQTDRPPAAVIRHHLGLRGEQLLLDADLGERCPDGEIRVLGGGLTGGDTDRFSWYEPVRKQQSEAGERRAKTAVRGPGGRFGRTPEGTVAGPATTSGKSSAGPAEPADIQRSPAPHQPPDSGFRISEISPPPARDPRLSTPEQQTSPSPSAPPPYDPADPYARGRLAERFYRQVSDARIAIAADLQLSSPLPFPALTPGSHPRGFVELSSRIREEGELAPAVCDRVLANAVKLAREKRSIDWLGDRLFGDKAWSNARDGVDPSARVASAARAGPGGRQHEPPMKIPTLVR